MTHWRDMPQAEAERELATAIRETVLGQPRRFVTGFLQVENKLRDDAMAVVPFQFTENQEYYYRTCFTGRTSATQPMPPVVGDKARQAYMSVFWLGMGFANFLSVPGWNMAIFAHRDDAAKTLLHYIDVFWEGLPEWFTKPPTGLTAKYWRDDHKEIDFGGGIINRIDVFSAQSNTVPRGGRYQMVHFSEGAHYRESYWNEVSAAVIPMQPIWEVWETTRRGTVYPDSGNSNQHYVRVRDIEQGGKGHLLRRFWHQDKANSMPPGHPRAISGTEGHFDLNEEELALGLTEDQARWRRAEIARYIQANGGNEKRGKAIFQQENLEYASNWANAEKTPFDIDRVTRYLNVKAPLEEDRRTAEGIRVQLYLKPVVGEDYAAGQDCASDRKKSDLNSVSIVAAGDGNKRFHVARLIGRTSPEVMTELAYPYCLRFNEAFWGIESNGGWGDSAIRRLKGVGYPRARMYRRPMERDEKIEKYQLEEYGFVTGPSSKNRIIQQLIDDFNAGRFVTYFEETLHMLENFDPTSNAHTPDEMISLAIANEMAQDSRVWSHRRRQPARETGTQRQRRVRGLVGAGSSVGVWGY